MWPNLVICLPFVPSALATKISMLHRCCFPYRVAPGDLGTQSGDPTWVDEPDRVIVGGQFGVMRAVGVHNADMEAIAAT